MDNAEQLLEEINLSNDLARSDMLAYLRDEIIREEKKVDVTGYWKGYNDQGQGLVEYRGKVYICKVLARRCRRYGSKVNLRRTPTGNYVNWD